jgi:hypothetical protein
MAQDFKAAFGLGDSDRHIATVDAFGVALASIQALRLRLQAKDAELQELRDEVVRLSGRLDALEGHPGSAS